MLNKEAPFQSRTRITEMRLTGSGESVLPGGADFDFHIPRNGTRGTEKLSFDTSESSSLHIRSTKDSPLHGAALDVLNATLYSSYDRQHEILSFARGKASEHSEATGHKIKLRASFHIRHQEMNSSGGEVTSSHPYYVALDLECDNGGS